MPRARSRPAVPPVQARGPWTPPDEEPFSWKDVTATTLAGAVHAVTALGYAIVLGRTSDGGAVSICILDGASKPRVYAADAEALEARLRQLTEWALDTAYASKTP